MANGTYGIRKPASITPDEADVFYHYRPTRGSDDADFSGGFKKIDSSEVLSMDTYTVEEEGTKTLPGMYNLKLPLDKFGKKGIYTIYIKPKEYRASILDVSTLAGSYSSVRGIVLDTNKLADAGIPDSSAGGLVGYRVEYENANGAREDFYRIITSNNYCVPVSQTSDSGIGNGVKYRLNNGETGGSLMFCTLTPSTSMSFMANQMPAIGTVNQTVYLINTKFNPVMLEVEMVEHDEETISTMLEGPQIRNLDNGIITTFDKEGNIYHQAAYGNIVNTSRGLHSDFKIPYDDNYVKNEEDKLAEIKEQVFKNG